VTRPQGPGHEHWADAAGAYLLGALPEDERGAYEAHLLECPACRDEVDDLATAAEALPASAAPVSPPPELKARIMAVVEREAALLAAAGPEADRPPAPARERPRRPWWRLHPRLLPVAGVLLGLLAGFGAATLLSDGARTVTAVVDESMAPGARAELEVEDDELRLETRGLPVPPAGRVYQVWLKRPGRPPEPTRALFRPGRDGAATAAVEGSHEGVRQVLVTEEPRGGSRSPTRPPVVAAAVPA
jgi:anti-sigma-K factor RskA